VKDPEKAEEAIRKLEKEKQLKVSRFMNHTLAGGYFCFRNEPATSVGGGALALKPKG